MLTTQAMLAPGTGFGNSQGRTLWSWRETTERLQRMLGSGNLKQNASLASASPSVQGAGDEPKFENLLDNQVAFGQTPQGAIDPSAPGATPEVVVDPSAPASTLGPSNTGWVVTDESAGAYGYSLTTTNLTADARPVYEEYAVNKMASFKCVVGSRTASFSDVTEIVARKGSRAVMNAYIANNTLVGIKYVRQGNGGGTGTNVLFCLKPSGSNNI